MCTNVTHTELSAFGRKTYMHFVADYEATTGVIYISFSNFCRSYSSS